MLSDASEVSLKCFKAKIVALVSIMSDTYLSTLPYHGVGGLDRYLDATSPGWHSPPG